MSLIWADFPSGQHGLYGRDESLLTSSGVYAERILNGGDLSLVDDPDAAIGSTGTVLRINANGISNEEIALRFALPSPSVTQGVSFRMWMDELPNHVATAPYFGFRDISNSGIIYMRVQTTGAIEFTSGRTGGTQYGATPAPVITAGAWNQIEIKVTSDAVAGAVELRVNGITKLTLADLSLSGNQIAQYQFGAYETGGTNTPGDTYFKDMIYWDTTGTEVNDFPGAIAVYDLYPDADEDLQWDVSRGSTGFNLLDDNKPANTLTASGIISENETVRINSTYYKWTSGSVDAGTPAGTSGNPWLVALGSTIAEAIENMFHAINASGTGGTTYSSGLTAHTSVIADGYSATQIDIESIDGVTTTYTCTETGANLAWTSSVMNQRHTDNSYISADDTPPSPSVFTMTDLPDDVTSIKGVFMIGRMYKTDGGDCNVQMSISPDSSNYDSGSDRPITVAPTIFWDASEISPATSSAWTPAEINSLRFRVDRTV